MTLNIFVLRENRLSFEHCQYFILFLSTSGAVSLTTGRNRFPVGYKLMSVQNEINQVHLIVQRLTPVIIQNTSYVYKKNAKNR